MCTTSLGVGIGGDYPLSSVISSEFSSTRIRGRLMTAVFAFQGWGNLGTLASWIPLATRVLVLIKMNQPLPSCPLL
jgi:MFS family permease